MADFKKSVEKLIDIEDGYTNDSSDSGGETKYGISKRSYPDEDIKNLTPERAKFLYKRDYWDPLKLDEWPYADLTYNVFELIVHSGIKRAVTILQISINALNGHPLLVEDGIFGSKSKAALFECDFKILNKCYKSATAAYYYYLYTVRKKDAKYIKGWLKRAYD